jgi:hypothetical protein
MKIIKINLWNQGMLFKEKPRKYQYPTNMVLRSNYNQTTMGVREGKN